MDVGRGDEGVGGVGEDPFLLGFVGCEVDCVPAGGEQAAEFKDWGGVSEAPCPGDEENGAFGEGFV